MTNRFCACGAPICKTSTTGRCQSCGHKHTHRNWRTCSTPGCENKIRSDNKVGTCAPCRNGTGDVIKAIRKADREARAKGQKVRRCFTVGCDRRIWKTNETGYCNPCQTKIDTEMMKEKLTNVTVKCRNPTCGESFLLREGDHPKYTYWCPTCRTSLSHQVRGREWVGGGEVGW